MKESKPKRKSMAQRDKEIDALKNKTRTECAKMHLTELADMQQETSTILLAISEEMAFRMRCIDGTSD